jgi:phosphopantetheine adenylyltransferase
MEKMNLSEMIENAFLSIDQNQIKAAMFEIAQRVEALERTFTDANVSIKAA